jgi:hypothetical protein
LNDVILKGPPSSAANIASVGPTNEAPVADITNNLQKKGGEEARGGNNKRERRGQAKVTKYVAAAEAPESACGL